MFSCTLSFQILPMSSCNLSEVSTTLILKMRNGIRWKFKLLVQRPDILYILLIIAQGNFIVIISTLTCLYCVVNIQKQTYTFLFFKGPRKDEGESLCMPIYFGVCTYYCSRVALASLLCEFKKRRFLWKKECSSGLMHATFCLLAQCPGTWPVYLTEHSKRYWGPLKHADFLLPLQQILISNFGNKPNISESFPYI